SIACHPWSAIRLRARSQRRSRSALVNPIGAGDHSPPLLIRSRAMDGAVADYLERSRDRHLAELVTLASFPSVSSASQHAGDVAACADWLAGHLERIGLEHVDLLPTGGNPIVYGDWLHAPDAPTVLVYGHYDVQPSSPDELWATPPFEPTVRDGRLFGRGVSDSKGQFLDALAAIEAYLATERRLPCNVRVLLEGEEELSADNLTAFLA